MHSSTLGSGISHHKLEVHNSINMDSAMISSYLFKAAATLNALAVPGHIIFGHEHLYPSASTLKPSQSIGSASAKVGFEHMTIGIFIAGMHAPASVLFQILIHPSSGIELAMEYNRWSTWSR